MRRSPTTLALVLTSIATTAAADTTQLSPFLYRVDEGVTFDVGSAGITDFVFNWSDDSGTFTGVACPALELVAGQTYRFQRTTTFHIFIICDDTLPVTGTDGNYQRATSDPVVIDNATLKPIEDFTADPAPTTDFIEWTPSEDDIGTYYYTCRILGHPDMTGRIEIIAPSQPDCLADTNNDGVLSPADFSAWIAAFNAQAEECDQNGDGSCTPADFSAWIANFNAGC